MRLTTQQIAIIKDEITRIVHTPVRIWLFGSRVDDTKKGGDIDLLVETEQKLNNRAQLICKISGALVRGLGDRKIDLLIQDADTASAPIYNQIKRTGIIL